MRSMIPTDGSLGTTTYPLYQASNQKPFSHMANVKRHDRSSEKLY
jgi:hypothetical protein